MPQQQTDPRVARQGDMRAQPVSSTGGLPGAPTTASPTNPAKPASSTTPLQPGAKNMPKMAGTTSPFKKFLPFIVGGLAILAVLIFVIFRIFAGGNKNTTQSADSNSAQKNSGSDVQNNATPTPPAKQVTLEYWGLWENDSLINEVIKDFQEKNPGIIVNYVNQSHKDYRERLQTAIASGNGPDLFRYHATWVPMFASDLEPVPNSVISTADFKDKYYPVALAQLQNQGQIVGIPVMYEGLALVYNKDILDSVGESPPSTWPDLRILANQLTVRSGSEITRAGIALGAASNVDNFSDILALLMLQNGAGDLSEPNSAYVRDAMLYYTDFIKKDKVWSESLPNSTVAFARGDVAMIIVPSWRLHEIFAMNPDLKVGVAQLPQLSDTKITWATYWAEGISSKSQHKEEAAKFLKFLTEEDTLRKLYSGASEERAFGELYSQPALAPDLADNEYVAPYLQDAPYATGWYLSSRTHDNGINDQLIKYYEDAVNAIIHDGKSIETVLDTVDQGTSQVLRQYNVPAK